MTEEDDRQLEDIQRRAKRILKQNATYVKYPCIGEDGNFTSEQRCVLYVVFDKGIEEEQEKIILLFLTGYAPHHFSSEHSRYRAHKESDVAYAISIDLSHNYQAFERQCLSDVGRTLPVTEDQLRSWLLEAQAARRKILEFLGGREFIPESEVDDLYARSRSTHDQMLPFMIDGEYFLDASDRPISEEEVPDDRYHERDSLKDPMMPKDPSDKMGVLRPATRIRPASEVVNDLGTEFFPGDRFLQAAIRKVNSRTSTSLG